MLCVKTKLAVSEDVHQTNYLIPVSGVFYSLCKETASHRDDHFASLSWKETLPSFQSLGKRLESSGVCMQLSQ